MPDGRVLYFLDTLGGMIEAADIAEDSRLRRDLFEFRVEVPRVELPRRWRWRD